MPITKKLGHWLLVVALAASALVVLVAVPASSALSEEAFEACLLDKINESRVEEGLNELEMALDLNPLTREWSEYMATNDDFRHMTAAERDPILPDGTYTWGENIAWHSSSNLPDCSTIHTMFMNSSGHRANILSANKDFASLGAHNDSSGWWVTELFFSSSSYSPTCEGTFCDDDSSPFEAEIEKLAASGITKGCNPPLNDQFCPDSPVTRGSMAAFIVRALNLTATGSTDFVDDDSSIFEAEIEKLAAAGITRGCNPAANDRFCPDSIVTRGQMAAFLSRALGLTAALDNPFTDDDSSIFETDIERLAAAGVTLGCNPPVNTRFCPDAPVTREVMAAFLVRGLDL